METCYKVQNPVLVIELERTIVHVLTCFLSPPAPFLSYAIIPLKMLAVFIFLTFGYFLAHFYSPLFLELFLLFLVQNSFPPFCPFLRGKQKANFSGRNRRDFQSMKTPRNFSLQGHLLKIATGQVAERKVAWWFGV